AFFMPACMSYALEYAGTSSGAAVGTYQAFMDMGIAVGPVVAGLIIPITGYSAMWLCLAALAALNFCYFKLYVMRMNRLKNTISLQTGGTK
ncbi:MAG TPA: hypothetical protein VHO84_00560, partial [Syntrophorhabdaceae bacterium]|nr:hypothetical protein [Syntrophorhabdaceae bacterium]